LFQAFQTARCEVNGDDVTREDHSVQHPKENPQVPPVYADGCSVVSTVSIISVDTVHVLGIILLAAIDNQAPFLIFDSAFRRPTIVGPTSVCARNQPVSCLSTVH
jgi:hypothetical protein